jgi:hypothetical protein
VSWNGATEVKDWVFYKSTEDGRTQVRIGSKPREGFETPFEWEGFASYVVVEGMDKTGNSLGSSKVIKTEEPDNMDSEDVQNEMKWLQDARLGKIHPGSKPRIHPEMFFEEPGKTLLAFLGGLALSPLIFFIGYKLRQRRSRASWWRKNQDQYAADYDETKLDDLSSDSHRKDDDSDHFDLTDDEDDDEQGNAEYGRLNARTPYARHTSGV